MESTNIWWMIIIILFIVIFIILLNCQPNFPNNSSNHPSSYHAIHSLNNSNRSPNYHIYMIPPENKHSVPTNMASMTIGAHNSAHGSAIIASPYNPPSYKKTNFKKTNLSNHKTYPGTKPFNQLNGVIPKLPIRKIYY